MSRAPITAFSRSGDEDGRVAGAARCFFDFEVFAGDFLGGFDHVTDAEAVLRA